MRERSAAIDSYDGCCSTTAEDESNDAPIESSELCTGRRELTIIQKSQRNAVPSLLFNKSRIHVRVRNKNGEAENNRRRKISPRLTLRKTGMLLLLVFLYAIIFFLFLLPP